MNTTASATTPLLEVRSRTVTLFSMRSVIIVGVAACLFTFCLNAFWREGYTGDEGFYGVTAKNMLHSAAYWLRPSYYPLGDFLADRDGFAHPPFNSYFYAVGLWLSRGSLVGPEVINLLALGALLYACYRVLARVDGTAAKIAVLLLAASPAITGSYSELEAEPLMTTFGLLGLVCCVEGGFERGGRRWLFLGGLCLGMAFALKLWLCGPLGLAVFAALGLRGMTVRVRARDYIAGGGLFLLGGVIPSGLHLAAIACVYPQDLGFWLKNIYFGIFTHAGISGSKFGGGAIPANWIHPVWYYGAALYRDEFFLAPPILFGAISAWREGGSQRRRLLVLTAGFAGVAPLSLIQVKEPLYVLTCAVFLYLIAAMCCAALLRRIQSGKELDPISWWGGTICAAGALLAIPAAYVRGIQGDKITLLFVVAHSLVYLTFLAALVWSYRARNSTLIARTLLIGCAGAVTLGFVGKAAAQRPRDPAIARLAQPYLAMNRPTEISFFASNFKSYQYYTFAKGCYWHDLDRQPSPNALLARPEYAHVRVFIMSPDSQAKPENAAWLSWLEANAIDKTPELDRDLGEKSGYRIFVREMPGPI